MNLMQLMAVTTIALCSGPISQALAGGSGVSGGGNITAGSFKYRGLQILASCRRDVFDALLDAFVLIEGETFGADTQGIVIERGTSPKRVRISKPVWDKVAFDQRDEAILATATKLTGDGSLKSEDARCVFAKPDTEINFKDLASKAVLAVCLQAG